jgi:hypothetical protein
MVLILTPWRHPGARHRGRGSPDAARHRGAPGGVDFIRRRSIATNRGSKLDGVARLRWSVCGGFFVRPCRVVRRVEAGRATYGCSALNRCGRQHGVVRMPRKLRRRRRSTVSMADCSAGHGWAPMGSRLGRSKRVGPLGSARLDRIGFLFIF